MEKEATSCVGQILMLLLKLLQNHGRSELKHYKCMLVKTLVSGCTETEISCVQQEINKIVELAKNNNGKGFEDIEPDEVEDFSGVSSGRIHV